MGTHGDGEAFYFRPFMIATEAFLGVRPARHVQYHVIGSPAGNYFGTPEPVDIWLSTTYARAGEGAPVRQSAAVTTQHP